VYGCDAMSDAWKYINSPEEFQGEVVPNIKTSVTMCQSVHLEDCFTQSNHVAITATQIRGKILSEYELNSRHEHLQQLLQGRDTRPRIFQAAGRGARWRVRLDLCYINALHYCQHMGCKWS
jgi:hypothetical protein